MRSLHNYPTKAGVKSAELFNRMKTPGCVGNTSNSESSAGSGRKWELLARATDPSTMDIIGKVFLKTTSMS